MQLNEIAAGGNNIDVQRKYIYRAISQCLAFQGVAKFEKWVLSLAPKYHYDPERTMFDVFFANHLDLGDLHDDKLDKDDEQKFYTIELQLSHRDTVNDKVVEIKFEMPLLDGKDFATSYSTDALIDVLKRNMKNLRVEYDVEL